jgi:subfamily B ATP-binding cassette protein MsbA
VKLFGLADELFDDFQRAVAQYSNSQIKLRRNQAILDNIYQMITAITVFLLIYVALTVASLSLAPLGVFLFAMFRLAPRVSTLNNTVYSLEGSLPHMLRTQQFVDELTAKDELDDGSSRRLILSTMCHSKMWSLRTILSKYWTAFPSRWSAVIS